MRQLIGVERRDVNLAGKLLGSKIPATSDGIAEATLAFDHAYRWRDAHSLPLKQVRAELIGLSRRARARAVTAARLKRMASIRKKLSDERNDLKLTQIQDLAGCRAIVPDMSALSRLVQRYHDEESRHDFKHTDYVLAPRVSGYRGHHLIMKFKPDDDRLGEYSGMKVEIQARTQLQHAWATTVEAVGLIRGEDLKGGFGCADWLRLFSLMGSEVAHIEGSPKVRGTSEDQSQRWEELKSLNSKLNAVDILKKYNQTFKMSEEFIPKTSRPFYLLQYDATQNSVSIKTFGSLSSGTKFEHESGKIDGEITSVLVAVDKVDNLRAAYPNYFMDVNEFAEILQSCVQGEGYEVGVKKSSSADDFSWLRDYRTKRR
ncbi:RelA/SpoT domain-containing protein [Pseudooctadecabacter jejudonensis]|uniref:GTP pyrophosphokinase YwaC n=1 Tax=Pseudooctadecabacter jejudonensis TaxID=1391910 RepID=A0A1Y5RN97_9RHOB|nr:RelA/SpoT domain-containing protein [Pseudooctadecabacter jejudonensis]SLN21544.1 GTP pyrophosphokinase YwaC [Pseudooctadecabacter jejudonensis]